MQAEEQRARSEAEIKAEIASQIQAESEASPPLSSLFQPAPPHPAEPAAAVEPEATASAAAPS